MIGAWNLGPVQIQTALKPADSVQIRGFGLASCSSSDIPKVGAAFSCGVSVQACLPLSIVPLPPPYLCRDPGNFLAQRCFTAGCKCVF